MSIIAEFVCDTCGFSVTKENSWAEMQYGCPISWTKIIKNDYLYALCPKCSERFQDILNNKSWKE